jgi:hypothetical protein
VDRKPDEYNPITGSVERSPPETTDCFKRRVFDLPGTDPRRSTDRPSSGRRGYGL